MPDISLKEVKRMIELRPIGNIFIAKNNILDDVADNLVGISNTIYSHHPNIGSEQNKRRSEKIYELLKMKSK